MSRSLAPKTTILFSSEQGFAAERVYELETGGSNFDTKMTVENVSDNFTMAQINIEYFFIDRTT